MNKTNDTIEDNKLRMFLIEMSIYQDQLLQNYRLIFISSQTILLSISMLLLTFNFGEIISLFYYFLLLVVGILLYLLWKSITENRALDVSYCHMQLLKLDRENDEKEKYRQLTDNERKKPFESFKNWQQYNSDAKRSKLNNYDEHLLQSTSRKTMEKLPNRFLMIWIIGIIIWIIQFIYNYYY